MQACGEASSVPDEDPGFATDKRCGWEAHQARDSGCGSAARMTRFWGAGA